MGKIEQPDAGSRPSDRQEQPGPDAGPDSSADPATEAQSEAGSAGDTPPADEDLLLTLQDARDKADEYWNQLLHARAELANMQRRNERELENAYKYGLEKFIKELLPVLDSLEMGVSAADGDSPEPATIP